MLVARLWPRLTLRRLGRLSHDDEPTAIGPVHGTRLLGRALARSVVRLERADPADLLDEGRGPSSPLPLDPDSADLRREIQRLADDYNAKWDLKAEEGDHDAAAKAIEKRAQATTDRKPNDEKEDIDDDEVRRRTMTRRRRLTIERSSASPSEDRKSVV